MLWLLLILVLSLASAGAVAIYVAYPRRGEEVPHAPWLGEAMKRGVASLPTIDNRAGQRAGRIPQQRTGHVAESAHPQTPRLG
jgi:hypothetical protein